MFPPVLIPIGVRLHSSPTWEEGVRQPVPSSLWETGEPRALDLLLSLDLGAQRARSPRGEPRCLHLFSQLERAARSRT